MSTTLAWIERTIYDCRFVAGIGFSFCRTKVNLWNKTTLYCFASFRIPVPATFGRLQGGLMSPFRTGFMQERDDIWFLRYTPPFIPAEGPDSQGTPIPKVVHVSCRESRRPHTRGRPGEQACFWYIHTIYGAYIYVLCLSMPRWNPISFVSMENNPGSEQSVYGCCGNSARNHHNCLNLLRSLWHPVMNPAVIRNISWICVQAYMLWNINVTPRHRCVDGWPGCTRHVGIMSYTNRATLIFFNQLCNATDRWCWEGTNIAFCNNSRKIPILQHCDA